MPKVKARRRGSGRKGGGSAPQRQAEAVSIVNTTPQKELPGRRMQRPQNLLMAGMLALGCWGFAFTTTFLTSDPNRYVFGSMAAIIALMWSIIFGVRLRKKWQQRRLS